MKAVQAVRGEAIRALDGAGREMTEANIATQAKWILDERVRMGEAAQTQDQALRRTGERTLVQLYRAALADPETKGSRRAAADKVALVMGDNLGAMGMDADAVRAFLRGVAGETATVTRTTFDPDLAWQKEKERLGGKGYNWLSPESWQRWYFLGSEAARLENEKKFPGDPQFRYENWHGGGK